MFDEEEGDDDEGRWLIYNAETDQWYPYGECEPLNLTHQGIRLTLDNGEVWIIEDSDWERHPELSRVYVVPEALRLPNEEYNWQYEGF